MAYIIMAGGRISSCEDKSKLGLLPVDMGDLYISSGLQLDYDLVIY